MSANQTLGYEVFVSDPAQVAGLSLRGAASVYAFMKNVGAVNDHIHGCFRAADYSEPQTNYQTKEGTCDG